MTEAELRERLYAAMQRLGFKSHESGTGEHIVTMASVATLVLQELADELWSNVTVNGQQRTWREQAERLGEETWRLHKCQMLMWDLDRCEHGRHEGDVCSSCGGPSKGNPLWQIGDYAAVAHDWWDEEDATDQRLRARFDARPGDAAWPERLVGFGLDGVPICVPSRPEPGSPPRAPDDYYRRA